MALITRPLFTLLLSTPMVAGAWTALLKDFSGFTGANQPAIPTYTYVKWDAGLYPEFCYDAANCDIADLEVYNVTYSDCAGYDPWTVCRCSDAQLSTTSMLDKFGQIPPGVRSYVVHMITVSATQCSGGSNNDRFQISGNCTDREYMHESMHSVDQGFHDSITFSTAYNADTCVPDNYALSNWAEDFAQVGVWMSYNINGHQDMAAYLGVNASCMDNQYAAIKTYAGTKIDQSTSVCSTRRPNDGNVDASGQSVNAKGARISSIQSARAPIQWEFEDYFDQGIAKINGTTAA
ncbi:hypothetical protein GQ53DRAFT_844854 [Thozetella sp. PMI_491]|nr:hypothetical protein GQ53DRAFT_844854 [Thozetella sp. PMI_491]